MRKSIEYPQFVFSGIKANHRGSPLAENLRIFGADTETYEGEPHTVQAYDGHNVLFEYVTPGTIFKTLAEYLFDGSRDRGVNICYIHFLRFDSPVIFYEKRLALYEQGSEIKFRYKGYNVEMLFGKINKITLERAGRKVHIHDSWSFTQAGLAKSLQMFKLDARKLDKSPALEKSIGRVRYNRLPANDPLRIEFETYAKVDATSEYALACEIMKYHEKYKVRPSISLPQFAARVFRHHFFKADEVIPFPPPHVIKAAEPSYHGGKNGFYLEKPTIIEDAYEVDISSAYPYAMTKIPQMMQGDYSGVREYDPSRVGLYLVSGSDAGKYPLVFDDEFKPAGCGFKKLWITSYELERCLKSPDVKLKIHRGVVWTPDARYKHNPIAEYVEHFYKLKESTAKDDPNYYFYKIMLNGLYGKFVQTTEIRTLEELAPDEDGKRPKGKRGKIVSDYRYDSVLKKFIKTETIHRAGGLYNPFIASLITGYVRAYLYDLETKYEAFHSATDAVKSTKKPKSVAGLGGLKIETFGRCYAFRNKLYLHFARSNKFCGHDLSKIKIFDTDGQHLCKFGLHGFKGKAADLFAARHKLMKGGSHDYSYGHMVGLREGFRRREAICSFVTRKETFKISQVLREWAAASRFYPLLSRSSKRGKAG